MLKKILIFLFVVVVGIVAYKGITGKSATDFAETELEERFEMADKAHKGDTIVCPVCGEKFVKDTSPFDSEKCEDRYVKFKEGLKSVETFEDDALKVYEDTKKSVKKNFGNR